MKLSLACKRLKERNNLETSGKIFDWKRETLRNRESEKERDRLDVQHNDLTNPGVEGKSETSGISTSIFKSLSLSIFLSIHYWPTSLFVCSLFWESSFLISIPLSQLLSVSTMWHSLTKDKRLSVVSDCCWHLWNKMNHRHNQLLCMKMWLKHCFVWVSDTYYVLHYNNITNR